MTSLQIILLVLAIVLVIVGVVDLLGGALVWGLVLIAVGLVVGAISNRGPRAQL